MRTAIAFFVAVFLLGCENGNGIGIAKIIQHEDKEHGVVCYRVLGETRLSCVKVK